MIEQYLDRVLKELREFILSKNRSYGNSAINPLRIFSKCNTIEQLNVRIDDKLSRIKRGNGEVAEDTELDLIGYLILKRVSTTIEKELDVIEKDSEKRLKEFEKKYGDVKRKLP